MDLVGQHPLEAEIRATMRGHRHTATWLRSLPLLATTSRSYCSTAARYALVGAPEISAVAVLVCPYHAHIRRARVAAPIHTLHGQDTLTVHIPWTDYTEGARELFEHFGVFRMADKKGSSKWADPLWPRLRRATPLLRAGHQFHFWTLVRVGLRWHHLPGWIWYIRAIRYPVPRQAIPLSSLAARDEILLAPVDLAAETPRGPKGVWAFGDLVQQAIACRLAPQHGHLPLLLATTQRWHLARNLRVFLRCQASLAGRPSPMPYLGRDVLGMIADRALRADPATVPTALDALFAQRLLPTRTRPPPNRAKARPDH